jgi:hypothetical protein
MNILPRNLADREAKSPCDKNIRYPVCVPGHDSPNGTTFLTIVVYDKEKTALVDDPSDLINTRRLSPGRKPLDLRCQGFLAFLMRKICQYALYLNPWALIWTADLHSYTTSPWLANYRYVTLTLLPETEKICNFCQKVTFQIWKLAVVEKINLLHTM